VKAAYLSHKEKEGAPMNQFNYSVIERKFLYGLAVSGLMGVNGAFLYATAVKPSYLVGALSNPVSLAFIVEALVLVGVLGYFLRRWNVTTMPLPLFVCLFLIGSLAFSVPIAMLYRQNK
jgi:RsiW-degrading membrane proteinase PrsW (M82 family)